MLDPSAIAQHSLRYGVRGPQIAFAIPQGDIPALEEILDLCCRFWGGRQSLIVPVTSAGHSPRYLSDLIGVSGVDGTVFHERVTGRAVSQLARRFSNPEPMATGLSFSSVHPLAFWAPHRDRRDRPQLMMPRYRDAGRRLIARAVCGSQSPDDAPAWGERFDIGVLDEPDADAALLRGQLTGRSPVELTAHLIEPIPPYRLEAGRALLVLRSGSFDDVVRFWNLRARRTEDGSGRSIVGVPASAFSSEVALQAILPWLKQGGVVKPDLYVDAHSSDLASVRAGLTRIGLRVAPHRGFLTIIGEPPAARKDPEFAFADTTVNPSPVRWGAEGFTLMTVTDRRADVILDAPVGYEVSGGGGVVVDLLNLPLPVPVTQAIAKLVRPDGYASPNGVAIVLYAPLKRWNLELRVPDSWTALQGWANDHGFSVELSQDGRYGRALLDRLGGVERLGEIRADATVRVLDVLTPASRKKLAQRVVAEARSVAAELDEALLAESLRRHAVFLELQALTLAQIRQRAGLDKKRATDALRRLLEAGLVKRGTALRCERCNVAHFFDLEAERELVRCPSCGYGFALPVLDDARQEERPRSYRLDGLMARAMDQDLLPVLLSIHHLSLQTERLRAAWPGLLFRGAEAQPVEADFLIYDGEAVFVGEAKRSATTLSGKQLRRLLALAQQLKARPVIAALHGNFSEAARERVLNVDGLVFEGATLVARS